VDLTFTTTPPADAFSGLPGVQRIATMPDGRTLRLTVQGGLDAVVKVAARYPLVNFVSREPSLEDIFLRYYQDDGAAAATATNRVAS